MSSLLELCGQHTQAALDLIVLLMLSESCCYAHLVIMNWHHWFDDILVKEMNPWPWRCCLVSYTQYLRFDASFLWITCVLCWVSPHYESFMFHRERWCIIQQCSQSCLPPQLDDQWPEESGSAVCRKQPRSRNQHVCRPRTLQARLQGRGGGWQYRCKHPGDGR